MFVVRNPHTQSRVHVIFLASWSGESAEALFALERTHRIDSLVLAFEQALLEKSERGTTLSAVERDLLAIEALEREVNNGGYSQFFLNSSVEFTPVIAGALRHIDCPVTADITERAITALGLGPEPLPDAVEQRMGKFDDALQTMLSSCDGEYYGSGEDIAGRLFTYLKANRSSVSWRGK